MRTYFLLSVLIPIICGCQQSGGARSGDQPQTESDERGVLSEYVNSPLEGAGRVDEISKERNEAYSNALDEIEDE